MNTSRKRVYGVIVGRIRGVVPVGSFEHRRHIEEQREQEVEHVANCYQLEEEDHRSRVSVAHDGERQQGAQHGEWYVEYGHCVHGQLQVDKLGLVQVGRRTQNAARDEQDEQIAHGGQMHQLVVDVEQVGKDGEDATSFHLVATFYTRRWRKRRSCSLSSRFCYKQPHSHGNDHQYSSVEFH